MMWTEWCLQTSNDQMLSNYYNQECSATVVSTASHVELSVTNSCYLIPQNKKGSYNFFIKHMCLKWVMP